MVIIGVGGGGSASGGAQMLKTMDTANHCLVLLQQLNMQREFGFLCDCTVAIGDVYFKAHRAVLAAFSNYFKMIFIHQTSECIKIQPTDIQPDIFSFLLHIMYTGKAPKQTIDHIRLEEGIRFLHAKILYHAATEKSPILSTDSVHSSNLYGIQISTAQKTPKESTDVKEKLTSVNGNRTASQSDHPQLQLSLAIGLEGVNSDQQSSHLPNQAAVNVHPAEDYQKAAVSIKQEKRDPDSGSPNEPPASSAIESPSISRTSLQVHLCNYCGEPFESRGSLQEHVHSHLSGSHPFGVPASILEGSDLGEVNAVLEDLENEENHKFGNIQIKGLDQHSELTTHSSLEPLQLNQLSVTSKETDPVELNCNFSFTRKRKHSCTVCGHKFLRKSQLLEHVYTHKGKPHKFSRYQSFGNTIGETFQAHQGNVSGGASKLSGSALVPLDAFGALELNVPLDNVNHFLIE
ncbi:zinc finger and BTB domain-containing protein 25 [Ambystoma mexicanum]|uniref:zinc finger and BTB domain-containing protein 25 n=1 Tax=Ambystoma mexicanum TaxID=8296 RepID=UPI0037E8208C